MPRMDSRSWLVEALPHIATDDPASFEDVKRIIDTVANERDEIMLRRDALKADIERLRGERDAARDVGERNYEGWQQADTEQKAAEAERDRLAEALRRIEKWFGEFPETGRTWDDGTPMSYAAAWGSNGERDFMRGVARAALAGQPGVACTCAPIPEPPDNNCPAHGKTQLHDAESLVNMYGGEIVWQAAPERSASLEAVADGYNPHFDAVPEATEVIAKHLQDDDSAYNDFDEARGQARRTLAALRENGLTICAQGFLDQARSQPAPEHSASLENGQLLPILKRVKEACLFAEDDGQIGITQEPHIPDELFRTICDAIAAVEQGPPPVDERVAELLNALRSVRDESASFQDAQKIATNAIIKFGQADKQGGDE